ncbi:MAG: O-antigen ligase family protein, partial [Limisphaerales bacterium]
LLLGIAIILFLGFRFVDQRHIGAYILAGIVVCAAAESAFRIFGTGLELLGRNDTLTGRTEIWQTLWNWKINPIFGAGFEGFWLGDRLQAIDNLYPGLNEAHNGYLETYLNLGIVGVFVTLGLLVATYLKIRRSLLNDFEFGRFRLAYLVAFIVYNCTEAAFRTNAFTFFMFFLIAIDYPKSRQVEVVQEFPEIEESEDDENFAYAQNQI